MEASLLEVGEWYVVGRVRGQLFRYEGRASDGAYLFSKFNARHPDRAGEPVGPIEVYNLESMEPWRDEDEGDEQEP